jgi:hypothetical protein
MGQLKRALGFDSPAGCMERYEENWLTAKYALDKAMETGQQTIEMPAIKAQISAKMREILDDLDRLHKMEETWLNTE